MSQLLEQTSGTHAALATFMVATFIVSLGISPVSKLHPTPISPSRTLVAVYVLVIFAGQIGYCVLLVLTSKEETKVHCLETVLLLSL